MAIFTFLFSNHYFGFLKTTHELQEIQVGFYSILGQQFTLYAAFETMRPCSFETCVLSNQGLIVSTLIMQINVKKAKKPNDTNNIQTRYGNT